MKKLHSILALLLITLCSMNFVACSDDDDEATSSEIIGKWAFSDDPDAGFIFKENGELLYWEGGYEDNEGTYRVSGKKLILECEEDGETWRSEYTITTLNSTTLIFSGYDEDEFEETKLIRVQ